MRVRFPPWAPFLYNIDINAMLTDKIFDNSKRLKGKLIRYEKIINNVYVGYYEMNDGSIIEVFGDRPENRKQIFNEK